MKNKKLSYLLGGFFAVLLGFGWLGGVVSAQFAGQSPRIDKSLTTDLDMPPITTEPATTTTSRKCGDPCDGIKLNTCFPIIGDCIESKAETTNPTNAFPTMISALTKIIMSVILVVCFILIIVAGIMWAGDNPKGAQKLIKRVAITILLLGFSGVILKLINPNFFS